MKRLSHILGVYLIGLLFGTGLFLSGMVYPSKVIGFLNITGVWDPSLVLVMVGGISVYALVFFATKGAKRTMLGYAKDVPTATRIDAKLLLGAILFGIGWGLYGYCPAPALVGIGFFDARALLFTASMVAGMYAFERYRRMTEN